MRECREPGVPCHRVIGAGGTLGGYGGREAMKRALLAAEGVPLRGARVVLSECRVGSRTGKR